MSAVYLVRYGAVPEVARFVAEQSLPASRGATVVVRTHRGLQLGTLLEEVRLTADAEASFELLRPAAGGDLAAARENSRHAEADFLDFSRRILQWGLELELIDVERTLDGEKRILYVLSDRGPDTTKLALQAAAAGLGIVEVQPVSAEGPVVLPAEGGGCGTGGGGGGCGCHS